MDLPLVDPSEIIVVMDPVMDPEKIMKLIKNRITIKYNRKKVDPVVDPVMDPMKKLD